MADMKLSRDDFKQRAKNSLARSEASHRVKKPNNLVAIVVAAGKGSRMKLDLPKQYYQLEGKTILEHTVAALRAHPLIDNIIIVIAKDDDIFATTSLATDPNIDVVFGGKERVDSVYAGLSFAKSKKQYEWVMVHDAARPLVTASEIDKLIHFCFNECQLNGSNFDKSCLADQPQESLFGAILATKIKETIKLVVTKDNAKDDEDRTECYHQKSILKTIPRENLYAAQTPQMFPLELLSYCLAQALNQNVSITDEASAVEFMGKRVGIVEGLSTNIKITEPEDIAFCEFYLQTKTQP